MKVIIGSDHGGYAMKEELISFLKSMKKYDVINMGCFSLESVDYPDIAFNVSKEVLREKNSLGILICGTGIGMSITANKVKGIRCALCSEEYSALMTRRHNDSNLLALGGRVIGLELAKSIVTTFLQADFDGGRHKDRINKIEEIERNFCL